MDWRSPDLHHPLLDASIKGHGRGPGTGRSRAPSVGTATRAPARGGQQRLPNPKHKRLKVHRVHLTAHIAIAAQSTKRIVVMEKG